MTIDLIEQEPISYVASFYAIYFSIFFIFLLLVSCLTCVCILCCKERPLSKNNKYHKKQFMMTDYQTLHITDKFDIINIFNDNYPNEKSFGLNKKILDTTSQKNTRTSCKKLFCCSKNKNNSTHDVDSNDIAHDSNTNTFETMTKHSTTPDQTSNNTFIHVSNNEVKSDKIEKLSDKKIHVMYTFDNLHESSYDFNESLDVFSSLEIFVNIVLDTFDPIEVGVLLKISSPGGYAYQFERSFTYVSRLRAAGFELIALIDDICASGGYMLACACNKIVCSEYANIGSVGVVMSTYNYHNLGQKIGIEEKTFTTGPYKRIFPSGEPYDDEDIQRVKECVNTTLSVFKEIVKNSRNLTDDELSTILSANVWYGKQAQEKKLVDDIMTSYDYVEKLIQNDIDIYIIHQSPTDSKLNSFFESLIMTIPKIFGILSKHINDNLVHRNKFIRLI